MASTLKDKTKTSSLTLNGLRLPVFLGVYPEEKLNKQVVSCDLRLTFLEPPKGCHTDRLDDTYCYDKIIGFLTEKVGNKHFQLLEHLTQELYQLLLGYFSNEINILIRVTKFVAIEALPQGVSFEYGCSSI